MAALSVVLANCGCLKTEARVVSFFPDGPLGFLFSRRGARLTAFATLAFSCRIFPLFVCSIMPFGPREARPLFFFFCNPFQDASANADL